MTNDVDIKIEGWEELQRLIKRVPEKVRVREIRKIMRRVAKPVQREIVNELPSHTGRLQNAFRFWSKKHPDFPGVSVGPAMRGKFYAPHWYLYLFGANENPRSAVTARTSRKTKVVNTDRGRARVVKINGQFTLVHDTGTMTGNNVVEKVFRKMNRSALYNQNKAVSKYVQKTIDRLGK